MKKNITMIPDIDKSKPSVVVLDPLGEKSITIPDIDKSKPSVVVLDPLGGKNQCK